MEDQTVQYNDSWQGRDLRIESQTERQTEVLPLIVRAQARSRREQRYVTECLLMGGFRPDCGPLPEGTRLAMVQSVIELTPHRREVLRLLVTCASTREIAAALGVEEKSARQQLERLQRHLGVKTRHHLLVRALEYGLLRLKPLPPVPLAVDPGLAVEVAALVLRVSALTPGDRDRIEACLRAGGYSVQRGPNPSYIVRLDESATGLDFTPREWDVIRRLLRDDHHAATAAALKIEEHVVRRYLGNLSQTTDTHNRTHLLVRLAAYGCLTVQPRY
jgi:DNA-binding CsgD family transcriptional regulator